MRRDSEIDAAFGLNGGSLAQGGATNSAGAVSGPGGGATEAIVKWFRSDKGYGFVELAAGQGDAFLHLKALRAFGRETVATGAKLRLVVGEGTRGMQVTRVIDIDDSCATPTGARPSSAGGHPWRGHGRDDSSAIHLTGRVKWFDGVRGFGFIAGDDYGRDVFVHCSVLRPAGVSALDQGQVVTMRVIDTPKGREAIEVSFRRLQPAAALG